VLSERTPAAPLMASAADAVAGARSQLGCGRGFENTFRKSMAVRMLTDFGRQGR
jgi:hypothetical protein